MSHIPVPVSFEEVNWPVTECLCARPKALIMCTNESCTYYKRGARVRRGCPSHPLVTFLMDLSQCPYCGQNCVEINENSDIESISVLNYKKVPPSPTKGIKLTKEEERARFRPPLATSQYRKQPTLEQLPKVANQGHNIQCSPLNEEKMNKSEDPIHRFRPQLKDSSNIISSLQQCKINQYKRPQKCVKNF